MIKLTPFIYFEHNIYNVFESNLKKKLCRSPVDPKYGCRPIVVSVACVSLISQRFQNVHRGSSQRVHCLHFKSLCHYRLFRLLVSLSRIGQSTWWRASMCSAWPRARAGWQQQPHYTTSGRFSLLQSFRSESGFLKGLDPSTTNICSSINSCQ